MHVWIELCSLFGFECLLGKYNGKGYPGLAKIFDLEEIRICWVSAVILLSDISEKVQHMPANICYINGVCKYIFSVKKFA